MARSPVVSVTPVPNLNPEGNTASPTQDEAGPPLAKERHFIFGWVSQLAKTKLASSFMVTAIIGGAVMPWCMGLIIDSYGWSSGFMMPLVCFLFIAFYGFTWTQWYARDGAGSEQLPNI